MLGSILPSYGGPIMMHVSYVRKYLGSAQVLLTQHLPRWKSAGIQGIVLHIQGIEEAATALTEISESGGLLVHTRTPEELESAAQTGAVGILLCASFDDVGNNPHLLSIYDRIGIVSFALSLNSRNLLVDGCAERTRAGLSELGIDVVQKLNRLGILVDVSHVSDRGFWDVLEQTHGGVIASHSNARALCDNPRNLTDAMISALADHGGLVGISTYPTLLSRSGRVTIDDAVRHIEHLAERAGPQHVAVGADFIDLVSDFVLAKIKVTDFNSELYGGGYQPVAGLERIEDFPGLSAALMQRGFSGEDVANIMGGNFKRVWRAALEGKPAA